ncbi:MOV10L1.2 family protein [Megaselia abdita]
MKRKRIVRSRVVRVRNNAKNIDNLRNYLRNLCIACSYYEIPNELEECVDQHFPQYIKNYNLKYSYPCIFEPLRPRNYVSRMETLVFIEEIYNRDLYHSETELFDVFIYYDERDDLYHVDGLENIDKKKPSIMIGGKVLLTEFDFYEYSGFIVEVYSDGFAFDSSDDIDDGIFNIRFLYSRTNTRKQLFSIGMVIQNFGFSFLFPSGITIKSGQTLNRNEVHWFNPLLNASQKAAVKNILRGYCRPMPYIVFGPPGTGKTITLVEGVCQIAALIEKSVILVAAPSNHSADFITGILSQFMFDHKFVRLVSVNYFERNMVPDGIRTYSISVKDISEKKIEPFKVIIGTCSTLASLHFHNLPPNYFSHAFIDEAGQCTEPEIMCPISLLDKNKGQVILVGDPLQMGPVIINSLCKSRNNNDRLERSFLERLMDLPPYQEDSDFDPNCVTKLIYNYRSIPSVLHGYNSLFYGNTLINMRENDNDITRMFRLLYNFKTNQDHGLYFFDIDGQTSYLNSSAFNNCEAAAVVNCANKLLSNGIKLPQIGIITPYLSQIDVISSLFLRDDLPFIGTIEEAQGQEFDIVLFSSVRTDKFGFIDAKRLNVAISRARFLLIIFGRANFLSRDLDWSNLIEYCSEEKAFTDRFY